MIQAETRLDVADNTGAQLVGTIRILGGMTRTGGFTRLTAGLGDVFIASVKKASPGGEVKAGDVVRCVLVRATKLTRRNDGSYVRFDHNAAVIIDEEGNPKGTRIFGAVARELRERNFMKIVSLASEVV